MSEIQVRDRVRVEGYDEIFRVLFIDASQQFADLACVSRVGFLSQVPLAAISLAEDPPVDPAE